MPIHSEPVHGLNKKMNGRVVFFPLKFVPSQERLEELEKMQMELRYNRQNFLRAIANESKFQQAIAHIRYKNLLRERLRIIITDACES
jgi:hypothetical protein